MNKTAKHSFQILISVLIVKIKIIMIEEKEIYPLTVFLDRYGGCYSGGNFIAMNLEPYEVNPNAQGGDVECYEFWNSVDKSKIGFGGTAEEAIENLRKKLEEGK